jgi:hypothetical protein
VSFELNSLRYIGLSMVLGLAACTPATDDAAAPTSPEQTAPTAAPAATPTATTPAVDEHAEHAAADGSEAVDRSITDAAPFGDDAMLQGLVPNGWKQAGPIEHYNVATLYNKINGRSELYMAYDVLGLSWVSFVKEDSPNDFLDFFVYDMRTPTNAFGIYSVEREPGQESAGLGRLSYRTGSNLYFWQGKYYGYMNASRENETNSTTGLAVLTALMPRLHDTGEAVAGIDLLPKDGLIEDTVQYFKVDAMSLDFLNDTWSGQYVIGDAKVRGFISQRASADECGQILGAFREYGDSYAESTSDAKSEGVDVVVSDWGGGFFDAAFCIGPVFAGASNVEGRENLDAAVASLIKQLKAR